VLLSMAIRAVGLEIEKSPGVVSSITRELADRK
jgi:hypothetical protein